jgi:16S rRNA G1207 methylase RsmC
VSHYFETPDQPADLFEAPMTLWGHEVTLLSSNGVFSARRLDPGTAVLLRTCDPPTGSPRLLDLGCGIGPITCALGLAVPQAQITAIDVNERAVEMTRLNAARLGLGERVTALTPDEVSDDERFDEIWSNPPIRIGKPALHLLLSTWLSRLSPQGRAYLVVARNLGADSLAGWLLDEGWDCQRLGSAKGYRVFRVSVG